MTARSLRSVIGRASSCSVQMRCSLSIVSSRPGPSGLPKKLLDAHGLDPAVWYNDIVEKNASLAVPVRKFIGGREMAASLNDENLNQYMAGMGNLGEKDVELALTLAKDKNTELPLATEAIKYITDAFLKQGQQRFE